MSVPQVDVATLAELGPDIVLIDVREPEEWVVARVPHARHLPLHELPTRVDEVPAEGPVYLICRSGARSNVAAEHLLQRGFDARNVAGGINAWIASGNPTTSGA